MTTADQCPWCDGALTSIHGTDLTKTGSVRRSYAHCGNCGQTWAVTVTMRRVTSVEVEQARLGRRRPNTGAVA